MIFPRPYNDFRWNVRKGLFTWNVNWSSLRLHGSRDIVSQDVTLYSRYW